MVLRRVIEFVGKVNNLEKIYLLIFVLSIAAGILYGFVNTNFYKCCENTLSLQPGEDNFTIFSSNLVLAALSFFTAGFSAFYFIFITFAISSSSMFSSGEALGIVFLILFGSLELLGVFLFGLSGFVIFERKILKTKSSLILKRIVLVATALIFFSAIFEYLIIR